MKKTVLILAILMTVSNIRAAINPQYGFEDKLPSFLSVNGDAAIELSSDKFKEGKHSVRFTWNGPSELVFSNFDDIESSLKVNDAGIMMWVYNTEPMKDPLRFTILDGT